MTRPSPQRVIADVVAGLPGEHAFTNTQIASYVLRALERNGYEITEILRYSETTDSYRDPHRRLG